MSSTFGQLTAATMKLPTHDCMLQLTQLHRTYDHVVDFKSPLGLRTHYILIILILQYVTKDFIIDSGAKCLETVDCCNKLQL